ncbi:MAG: 3-phosphoshikimate 1-carboxyvinyltransferase [Oscillospiraceae bacterium]|nr:3-phosphoshikimate 1-carboxyvinyltransferase [Oscillospiraceae bacterium]
MDVKIIPRKLSGEVAAITSKSAAHRALICAALCREPAEVKIKDTSKDIEATKNCLEAMKNKNSPLLDCRDCGATFRLLLPLSVNLCNNARFTGEGKLPERPILDLLKTLRSNGAEFSADKLPFTASGKLKSGEFVLPGNISSQFVSGLLFALPLLDGGSVITLTSPLESKAYADMTLNMLKDFGVEIIESENQYKIKGGQKYKPPAIISVENDWSNAAFWLAAGALEKGIKTSGLKVTGLNINSAQSDKKIVKLLRQFCAAVNVNQDKNTVTVFADDLKDTEIDVSEITDLVPVLAVLGACANGKTVLYNGARLRLKECDRISSVREMLRALGAEAEETADSLIIYGDGKKLRGGIIDGKNDHRIIMAAAICTCFCENEVIIKGAEAAEKSYPRFFEDYKSLGGEVHVV